MNRVSRDGAPDFARWWEYVTWGPLYFVRRAVCRVRGHDWQVDYSDAMDFQGTMICARCMEGA